jgi:hypothetical protein
MKHVFYVFLVLAVLMVSACENTVSDPALDNSSTESPPAHEEVVTKIIELKNSGVSRRIGE